MENISFKLIGKNTPLTDGNAYRITSPHGLSGNNDIIIDITGKYNSERNSLLSLAPFLDSNLQNSIVISDYVKTNFLIMEIIIESVK